MAAQALMKTKAEEKLIVQSAGRIEVVRARQRLRIEHRRVRHRQNGRAFRNLGFVVSAASQNCVLLACTEEIRKCWVKAKGLEYETVDGGRIVTQRCGARIL